MKFMSLINPTDFVKVELRLRKFGVMYRWKWVQDGIISD